MPRPDHEDPLDQLDPLASPESMDLLENQAPLLNPHHHSLEMLAQSEMLVQRDLLDHLVLLVPTANPARKDLLDLQEKLVQPAAMVNKEHKAHLARLDHLANGESARNTALWTVEFSSKMAHGGKRAGARLYIKIEKGYVKKLFIDLSFFYFIVRLLDFWKILKNF